MKMRTGDARIANECESIQHGKGCVNIPAKHETPSDRQTQIDRKQESNKGRANRVKQQSKSRRKIKVPKKTHTHDPLIQLEESQCSAYCQMTN
jgi:hypothetical protein